MKPHDEARPSNNICGPKLPKTPRIDGIKNHPKIAKTKRLGSMGDHTQEWNHSYINIIEVIYKARETSVVLPLLVKIKGSHTTLSPLMKHNPSLAREK